MRELPSPSDSNRVHRYFRRTSYGWARSKCSQQISFSISSTEMEGRKMFLTASFHISSSSLSTHYPITRRYRAEIAHNIAKLEMKLGKRHFKNSLSSTLHFDWNHSSLLFILKGDIRFMKPPYCPFVCVCLCVTPIRLIIQLTDSR
jgi:hypothetical protein